MPPVIHRFASAARAAPASRRPRTARLVRHLAAFAAGAAWCGVAPAQLVEVGPFSLSGFVKGEIGWGSNVCDDCQREPGEDRHRLWADDLAYGRKYGTEFTHGWLFQPTLNARFNLGGGYRLTGTLSQRYRDGSIDFPGFWYDRSVTLSHEDYGALQVGAFVLRTWGFADFPYATDIGMSPVFSDSGAGYGLAKKALRYTSRLYDVAEGDLLFEVTWDRGDTRFKVHKPRLLEYWVHYGRRDLRLELLIQDTRNGRPSAFSHGPFSSLTSDPADDAKLGKSSQSVVMLLGKYRVNAQYEASGGIRFNRWSGAYAVPTSGNLWNAMFNVHWGGFDNSPQPVANPGYPARTTDVMLGVRRFDGPWASHVGMTYLSEARTSNPLERGQSNSAWYGSVGTRYDLRNGLQLYGSLNAVVYGRKGLAPLSLPSHSAFSNVDSRVANQGNWITLGAIYNF